MCHVPVHSLSCSPPTDYRTPFLTVVYSIQCTSVAPSLRRQRRGPETTVNLLSVQLQPTPSQRVHARFFDYAMAITVNRPATKDGHIHSSTGYSVSRLHVRCAWLLY